MIVGSATLQLSEATLCEAVEEYLNRSLVEGRKVKVQSVKPEAVSGGYGTSQTFKVEVKGPEPVS